MYLQKIKKKIGFIGLGNVGGKLAGSLIRNNFDVTVREIDESLTNEFKKLGAKVAKSPKELAEQTDLIITSLPSPEVSAEVMESEDGILNGLSENKIWLEMSTTDEDEVKRLGNKVISKKAIPLDGPVSGGCHRAATGNITIFVGGDGGDFTGVNMNSGTIVLYGEAGIRTGAGMKRGTIISMNRIVFLAVFISIYYYYHYIR